VDSANTVTFKMADSLTERTTKIKTNPLQAWTGSEGSRKLRLPDFKKIGT